MFESVYIVLFYIYVICAVVLLVNGIIYNYREKRSKPRISNKYYEMFLSICVIGCVGSFLLLVLMFILGILGGWIK